MADMGGLLAPMPLTARRDPILNGALFRVSYVRKGARCAAVLQKSAQA
jgi:hypothetical protein